MKEYLIIGAIFLIVWTVISCIYAISRIGYQDSDGIRGWLEYLAIPALGVASIMGYIAWRKKKGRLPVICITTHDCKPSSEPMTQVRFTDDYNIDWYVNVYQDRSEVYCNSMSPMLRAVRTRGGKGDFEEKEKL